ncbi:Putative aminoacrylate peracid reductase RutC [Pigmentiphaga humi]|uniref:Aminoacrylate peracid reductase RutC n=1 Tax=Pigmentiphaga humi TaxID=2478468 RepID=A0A3P4B3I8_9BURK|nr:Rid family hydrolase [Pigmentiphaga humi]VCU70867.1 Putative aminoacrylate peracid reductase RutC [Pigmentiphaga humi]
MSDAARPPEGGAPFLGEDVAQRQEGTPVHRHEPVLMPGAKPWPEAYTYVPAIRTGNTVYISGTTGTDDQGRILAPGDIAEQARQIFRKFERLLGSLGGSFADIVMTTDYYVDPTDYRHTAEVRREFFGTHRPAATGVQVQGLIRRHALIEISAIAVLGGRP